MTNVEWRSPLPVLHDGRKAVVTSEFGPRGKGFHYGVDLGYRANASDPVWTGEATEERTKNFFNPPLEVMAAASGYVTEAQGPGWNDRIRGRVRIRHHDGSSTVYYHLQSVAVAIGQGVSGGHVLGVSGRAGDYIWRHLHFEYYPAGVLQRNGNQKDPAFILKERQGGVG